MHPVIDRVSIITGVPPAWARPRWDKANTRSLQDLQKNM